MTMTKRQGERIGMGILIMTAGLTAMLIYMLGSAILNKANAGGFGNSSATANATGGNATIKRGAVQVRQAQGQMQGQGQAQKQGQFQGQGQGQRQFNRNDNRDVNANDYRFEQKFESRPSGPSIAIGLAGLPSFSNSGIRNACGGLEAWTGSIGGSVGLSGGQISGSGGLLGFGDSTMNALILCEIRESVAQLGDANVPMAATAAACLHPVMAFGLEYAKPGTCAGITAVSEIATDDLTIAKVTNPNVYKTAPVAYVAPAPAPAPKPTGNATNGKCTYGFDAARGQCAKVQAFADIGRSDS